MDFMEENNRRPSKFVDEERGMRNWWKHQQGDTGITGIRDQGTGIRGQFFDPFLIKG